MVNERVNVVMGLVVQQKSWWTVVALNRETTYQGGELSPPNQTPQQGQLRSSFNRLVLRACDQVVD